jgi:hypothetical protein
MGTKFLIKSSFVIPIPQSRIEMIFFCLSNLICIISFHMFQTNKKKKRSIFNNTCTNFHQKHPQSQLFGFTMGSAHYAIKSNHLINEIIPFLSLLLHILISIGHKNQMENLSALPKRSSHMFKNPLDCR